MAQSGCGPKCASPWTPRYRYLDLLFALMGTAAFLVDLAADAWVAASYLQAGRYYWGGLVLLLLGLSSLTTQLFSWAWYQSDPKALRRDVLGHRTLLILHLLQLGYLYRCLHALKAGFHVCRMEAATEVERGYAVFLSHDISLLRLFETFLESAPQLTLVLYIILHTSKAETFQIHRTLPITENMMFKEPPAINALLPKLQAQLTPVLHESERLQDPEGESAFLADTSTHNDLGGSDCLHSLAGLGRGVLFRL